MSDVVKGILIDRDRPAGSGWCGAENCNHASHKHYNAPAKAIKPKKAGKK